MPLRTFMVVATIRDDADQDALMALVPQEVAHVEHLRGEGRLGAVHVAFARRVIFLEVFGEDEDAARGTVLSLPMGGFFDLDVYVTAPAAGPAAAIPDTVERAPAGSAHISVGRNPVTR